MRYGLLFAALILLALTWLWFRAPSADAASYPSDYLRALETQAGVEVQEAHFAPFISFVQNMSSPDWQDHFDPVYAPTLHFSDTLAVVKKRDKLRDYFKRLHNAGAKTKVNILARHRAGQDGYLIWEMHSHFKPVGTERQSHTIGMTHLRFDEQGRVVLHQDFWDAAQGFYQHLPVLGSAVISIRERLQPADS